MPTDSATFLLPRPILVARATDTYLTPTTPFPDEENLPGVITPMYGQDITYGYQRAAPQGQNVGSTTEELKPKMRRLLEIFASGDSSGMAARLFDTFLLETCRTPQYFDDADLNAAADAHANIIFFCHAALSAPNSLHRSEGKIRIHQALKRANWDINQLHAPTDLGVPAFNIGNKTLRTGDFNNGLGVMLNGVQRVYVMATAYHFDSAAMEYSITLRYIFYDIFGLDDDDLNEYGADSDSAFSSNAAIGITAWWQLQHQHGLAPLVTRIILEKTFNSPAE